MRLASLYYSALKVAGLTAIARRLSSGGVILCYHNIIAGTEADPSDSLGLHMPLATFSRQMRWLARTYQIVPLAELVSSVSNGGSLRGVGAVTFDDGYAGVFENAWPVLRDLGIRTTEEEVLRLTVSDKPGVLGEIGSRLGQVSINMDYAYATVAKGGKKVDVVLGVSDLAGAAKALKGI